MLEAEVEYLTGVVVAASDQRNAVDWPPQTDRLYSALVASWGARGRDPVEREALEWLECQPAPRLSYPPIASRTAPTVFVPVNDVKTAKKGEIAVLPASRTRQPRSFLAARLQEDRPVRFFWPEDPPEDVLASLDALARDTSYVGHSSSLTRCRFRLTDAAEGTERARFRIGAGRLEYLEQCFLSGQRPSERSLNDAPLDPEPGMESIFSRTWITLRCSGTAPSIFTTPLVARTIRDALMDAYSRGGAPAPEWLSGHGERDIPSRRPHLAIVPIPNVGWQYATGSVLGFALMLPAEIPIHVLAAVVQRLMEPREDGTSNIEIATESGSAKMISHYEPTLAPDLQSLQPARWIGLKNDDELSGARQWATVMPIALDRRPVRRTREERNREMCESIALSCERIGLPRPIAIDVRPASSVEAAPSVFGDGQAKWVLPSSLRGRMLTHARILFPHEVRGPIILGAGRYVGLGLCLPQRVREA